MRKYLNVVVDVLEKGFVRARSEIANDGIPHFDVGFGVQLVGPIVQQQQQQ